MTLSQTGLTRRLGQTVLAIDPGSVRVGVAVSDPTGKIALPVSVITRVGNSHIKQLEKIARERAVDEIVVGLPKTLKGTEGPAADAARSFADELHKRLGLPVHLFDERLTTLDAHAALRSAGVKGERQGSVVDKVAATLLLQAFLDARGAAQARHQTGERPSDPENSSR
ncbi:MAG: Holliday junction resolvase RuvX [Actinomycetota bacterium]